MVGRLYQNYQSIMNIVEKKLNSLAWLQMAPGRTYLGCQDFRAFCFFDIVYYRSLMLIVGAVYDQAPNPISDFKCIEELYVFILF